MICSIDNKSMPGEEPHLSSSARTKLLASSETCAQALPRNCGSCVRMAFHTCAQACACWKLPCRNLDNSCIGRRSREQTL